MFTAQEILLLLEIPSETNNIEFKEAKNNYDDNKLFKYCVALANCGGGKLVLGITDKRPRTVVGTNWPSNCVDKQTQIYNKLKFRVEIHEVYVNEKRVVVFEIPSRPKARPYDLDGAYYTRIGEELRAMSADELSSIFDEDKDSWENLPAKKFCTQEEILALLDANSFYELRSRPFPSEIYDIILDLKHEGLVNPNEDHWDITNMGAILFAKNLRDFPNIERKAIRLIVYNGTGRLETNSELDGKKGYATGFEGLINYVKSIIPANEVIKDALRTNVPIFPLRSIREIVANAMIHQDFSISGSYLKIELFSDRIEITNPGVPKLDSLRFVDECISRNDHLASFMRQLGICEERGSGFDKVISESEVYQLPPPQIVVKNFSTTVTLYAPRSFEKMSKDDRIRACYLHCCLKYVQQEKMNNLSLRNRFKLNSHQISIVSSIIKDTIAANLIKVNPENKDSSKYRTYLPYWA